MKKLKKNEGITLVALVVTIIVLLILAGVALSAVLSQDGIFSRAEQAVDKHGEAKARETLELALGEAQMQKYEQGLTDKQLTEKINVIGEELPKEKPEHPELQNVIVDGHIFEIDRSVPKIVDYIGPADGVIITASVTQNGNWENPIATITGTIKTYSGGNITNVSATKGESPITDFSIDENGRYEINNIAEDIAIKITAQDSNKKKAEKTIKVQLVRDTTPPIINDTTATAILMKIKISATATDNESGLKQLKYTVTPNTIKDGKAEGTLTSGVPIEIEATTEENYTVTFIAEDNAGNVTIPGITMTQVRTTNTISIADLKKNINKDNYPDYIGKEVNDYNPQAGGVWRVFYYDATGEFGDGEGTIYLKRDDDTTMALSSYTSHNPADGGALMKQLNPKWAAATNGSAIDLQNEHCAAWLCDSTQWTSYKTSESKYAIGAAPIEMWIKAYNAYVAKYEPNDNKANCEIQDQYGYGWKLNEGGVSVQQKISINTNISQSKVIATERRQWIASPSYGRDNNGRVNLFLCIAGLEYVDRGFYGNEYALCPVVSLNH